MGSWGVKSYENDDANDALDAAFDRVHGDRYESLMDDRNPMTFDEVQKTLATPETLAASIAWLTEEFGPDREDWDEDARLALAGVVVRHAESGVPIPAEWRGFAVESLEGEAIEWEEATIRRLRKQKEVALLKRCGES